MKLQEMYIKMYMEYRKTIILCPYPIGRAPSQRFRFEQYLLAYNLFGQFKIRSFYSERGMNILYGNNLLLKLIYLVFFIIRRKFHVLEALGYNKVFIHRELAPIGPPIYEWFLHLFGKKIIYDFDDAIWLSNVSDVNRKFNFSKAYWKVKYIIKWADFVTVGNAYLSSFAQQYNDHVEILPSTVDMENVHIGTKNHEERDKIIIGWTGSHTTAAKYLPGMKDVFFKLADDHNFELRVISNQRPLLDWPFLKFLPWAVETEISDLVSFDIGIMPLGDNDWEKGKCSFKAIQYMALGIPTVLSPKGNNLEVVENQKDGLFADTDEEWINKLSLLIENLNERVRLGGAAKLKIRNKYSLASQTELYNKILY